ncbi:MAG: basic amino acid ABC transporter substrate-binding protein [Rickettsiales bacterium]|jgi:ABC-type amino acid transport substrate-binding protein|nr:basic amino acid ABC transporter substrate-binding protein [Rickettsiales bacterium]
MKKILYVFLCVATLGFTFVAFANLEKKSINTSKKTLIIGTDPQYAPFTFLDNNNKNVGFDIDIMTEIAKELNYNIKYLNMNFEGLLPSLLTEKINLIAGSMVITEERAKKINFSDEYYKAGLSIVVNINNNNIKSVKDLKGKTIGVHIGTVGAYYAHTIKDVKIVEFDNMADVWLAIINNKVDAMINDHPMNLYYIKTKGNIVKIVGDILETQYFGFGINKNAQDLLNNVNEVLRKMKKDGRYDKIYKKWF